MPSSALHIVPSWGIMGAMKRAAPAQAGEAAPVCVHCHQRGTGCCRLADGDTSGMFGLTRGEVETISRASGLEPEEFTVRDQAPPEFLAQAARLHPVFLQTMPGGRRIRLKVDPAGACCFLGPQGCRLPEPVRPLYCRLYPIWFTPEGRLMVMLSDRCLAQEGAHSWREVLARLGVEEEPLRELFAQLLALAADHLRAEGKAAGLGPARGAG